MVEHRNLYKPQSRSRASLIILIVLAFLLMLAAIVLVASLPEDETWPATTETAAAQPALTVGFDCSAVDAQTMYPFGAGVVRLTSDRLAYLNIQGSEIFSEDLEMSEPFCVIQGEYFLAADRDGHTYVMLNAEGVLFRGNIDGLVSGAAIRPDGTLALIQDQTGSTGVVSLFAADTGTPLFDCHFPESGYPLSVAFPSDLDAFDVAIINTNGSTLQPMLKRYSLAGEALGQLRPDLQSVFPIIRYDPDNHPVLCGSAEMAAMSYDSDELIYTASFAQIQSVQETAAGLVVLAAAKSGGKLFIHAVDNTGKTGTGLEIGDDVTDLAVAGSLVAMGSGTTVDVFDCKNQSFVLQQNMAIEVIRVGFSDQANLTVVTGAGVRRLPLQTE